MPLEAPDVQRYAQPRPTLNSVPQLALKSGLPVTPCTNSVKFNLAKSEIIIIIAYSNTYEEDNKKGRTQRTVQMVKTCNT